MRVAARGTTAHRRRALLASTGLVAILAAGCGGGRADADAVRQQAGTLRSVAAEGVLVAEAVEDGGAPPPFVRVHADELAASAESVRRALERGSVAAGALRTASQARRLAGQVAARLHVLADHPSDRGRARRVAAGLARAAARAGELEGGS